MYVFLSENIGVTETNSVCLKCEIITFNFVNIMLEQIKVTEDYILLQFAEFLGFRKAHYIFQNQIKKTTMDIYIYFITQLGYIVTW